MSIQSKARRDARRRKEQREHNRARAGAPPASDMTKSNRDGTHVTSTGSDLMGRSPRPR